MQSTTPSSSKPRVRTTTLDELVSHVPEGGRRNIYLKLDTQGSDLEALQGASCALARVAALQTEASFKRSYQGAPKYSAVVDFLNERGFELSAVHPNNGGHFQSLSNWISISSAEIWFRPPMEFTAPGRAELPSLDYTLLRS